MAGGEISEKRFPWDTAGKQTTNIKEIVKRANVSESGIKHTTPVDAYLRGASLYNVMDLAGNVDEWQANYYDNEWFSLRGGSWKNINILAHVAVRGSIHPVNRNDDLGFRVVVSLPSG